MDDVTNPIRDTLRMFIESDQARARADCYETLAGEPVEPNWSPQMRTAMALLAELERGRITCTLHGPPLEVVVG